MDKEAKKESLNKCDITAEDLEQLEDVLEEVAKNKKINIASDSLKELKEDVDEYKEVRIMKYIGKFLDCKLDYFHMTVFYPFRIENK